MTIQKGQEKSETTDWQVHLLEYCLRLSTFFCFAGWAWGHLYWEPSYASILWNDTTFTWFQQLGYSWEEFVGTGANNGLIQKFFRWIGWLFLGGSILSFTVRRNSWIQLTMLLFSGLLILAVALGKFIKSEFELPMLVEHGGQILSPILLVIALSLGVRHRITVTTAIIAFWMTFAGHGLYAVGIWPTPATFVGMTRVISGLDADSAKLFLLVVGILDLTICFGIAIPFLRRTCALYALIWGMLTAAARPVAGMSWDLNYWGADQFLHESVYRAPHVFIPLYLFLLWSSKNPRHSISPPNSAPNDSRVP